MSNNKTLVACFSASGITRKIAQAIAEAANAELFEIKPEQPYTSADLNWNDKQSRSSKEKNNPEARPEIANKVDAFDRYDTIFIGFPIWWYTAPAIVATFLESYDFSGKTIIPFATSGGSGIGKTVEDLKPFVASDAKWIKGKRIGSKQEVSKWISNLNL